MGEKRFDTVYDLVADGLIHFYIELKAADYIKQLSNESTYEESPYMAYNQCRLRHDKTLRLVFMHLSAIMIHQLCNKR